MVVWAVRIFLLLAIAVQIGYIILFYRTTAFDFAWWFGIGATIAFSALMVFGTRAFAAVLRIGLGLVLMTTALSSEQSCAGLGTLMTTCGRVVSTLRPWTHGHVMLPAIHAASMQRWVTVLELGFGLLLIIGLANRLVCGLAGLFLLAYGSMIANSFGLMPLLHDATPVLCAGAFLLSTMDSSLLGSYGVRGRRGGDDPFLRAFDEVHERTTRAWPARPAGDLSLAPEDNVLQDDIGEAM